MKEAIYSWIKCLAIFYILLTMLLHLVPTENTSAMCVFHGPGSHGHAGHARAFPFGKKPSAARQFFGTLPAGRAEAPGTGNGESPEKLLETGMEEQLGENILESLQKNGIEVLYCEVHIEGINPTAATYV